MDNLLAHMRRGLVWTTAQQWGVQAIRLAVLMVLARMVSSASFGVFAFASTTVGVAHLFGNQGMTAALVQRRELEDRHVGAAFVFSVGGSLFLTALLIAGAPLFGRLLSNHDVVPLLRFLAWMLPLWSVTGIATSLWRRNLDFKRIAVVNTAAQLLASGAAITLAFKGFGAWSLAVRVMGEAVLLAVFTFHATPWKLLLRTSWRGYGTGYIEMARIGFSAAAVNLMALGRNRVDELLIGSMLGVEALGFYALARRQIDGVASLVPVVIGNALQPVLSRVQHDATHIRIVMLRGIGLLGAVTLPAFAGIGAAAGIWVPLLLGPRWMPSVPVIYGLAIVAASRAVVGFSTGALFAIGHPGKRLAIEMVGTAISLLITVASMPWGIRIVAYASASAMLVLSPFELAWMSRWIGISLRDQIRALRRPLFGSTLLLVFIVLLQNLPESWLNPTLRLSIAVAAALAVLVAGYRGIPSPPPLALPGRITHPD